MWPTLVPGRKYFASLLYRPKPGRIIVFKNPLNGVIYIKKVSEVTRYGYKVESEVSWGAGKELGVVPDNAVLGVLFTKDLLHNNIPAHFLTFRLQTTLRDSA